MLNILSWADVCKNFKITVDAKKEECINVHISKDKMMKFNEISLGLYIWSLAVKVEVKILTNPFLLIIFLT